jgi:hypothetical protein
LGNNIFIVNTKEMVCTEDDRAGPCAMVVFL